MTLYLLILLLSSYSTPQPYNFHGKWQSLNTADFQVEIANDDSYTLYRDGKPVFQDLEGFDQLKMEIERGEGEWNSFTIADESQNDFSEGRIEIVDTDRIRIYWHKHHDILDLADEFHRTVELESLNAILRKISKGPE